MKLTATARSVDRREWTRAGSQGRAQTKEKRRRTRNAIARVKAEPSPL